MTRGTVACCRCGAVGHIADACPEPPGAEYVPEPVYTTDDAGDTWMVCMTPAIYTDPDA